LARSHFFRGIIVIEIKMPTVNRNSLSQDWQATCKVVNSGVVLWAFISYPFHLQQEGEGLYFVVSLILAYFVVRPIFINELGVGQLNQSGLINVWGNMVPVLRGTHKQILLVVIA